MRMISDFITFNPFLMRGELWCKLHIYRFRRYVANMIEAFLLVI